MSQGDGWQRWSREPLVRFLALALVILALDRGFGAAPPASHKVIRVGAGQQAAARAAFRAEQGHEPDPAELQQVLAGWIDEQVLYREAVDRGLDRGDSIVRRQLVQKMRFLIEGAAANTASDDELRAWYAGHPDRYGTPATVDFEHVFLSRAKRDGRLEADADAALGQLRRAPQSFTTLGDPFPVPSIVAGADPARVRREFGSDFAAALRELPEKSWAGPLVSPFGLHLVRVTARTPARPLAYETVAARVRADWQADRREAARREALDRLRARYRIELEAVE